ncbi:MAG: Rrf2 family transcriptional regulator [Planctomycetota bacterium]
MKLTKTSTQAALAMAFLSQQPESRPVQARQVADHLGIPNDSALKVLQALARQRLLRSRLGRAGGYQMSRPASAVTLLEIIEAIDGPVHAELPLTADGPAFDHPLGLLADACRRSAECLREELGRQTVADLVEPAAAPLAVAG